MKTQTAILALVLIACQAPQAPTTVPNTPTPSTGTTTTDTGTTTTTNPVIQQTATPITLTYYTLAITPYISGIGATVPMTAYCVVYSNQTYCWDNGIQTKTLHTGSQSESFNFSFWGMTLADTALAIPYGACSGDCQTDFMNVPTLMTANLETSATDAQESPAYVLANGTAAQVSCTLSSDQSTLNCGAFSVAL